MKEDKPFAMFFYVAPHVDSNTLKDCSDTCVVVCLVNRSRCITFKIIQ